MTCLFDTDDMFSFADIQTRLMLLRLDMVKPGSNSTFLRYNARFEVGKELLGLLTLYFSVLNSTPT